MNSITEKPITWRHGIFVLLVTCVLRAPSFWVAIVDVDEAQFASFAHTIMEGSIPYVASLDTKPLGIYWFFAAVFALFGRYNMYAVHVATALWVAATAYFCFRIARRIYSPRAGFWAALFYAVFTTTFIPKFIGTSITIIMMLPLVASIDALLLWEETGRRRYVLFSGMLWGAACLFKYQAGINLVVVGLYLLIIRPMCLSRRERGPLPLTPSLEGRGMGEGDRGKHYFKFSEVKISEVKIVEFLLFLAGGTAIGCLFVIYLRWVGAWEAFVFWSLKGSIIYVGKAAGHTNILMAFPLRVGTLIASSLLMWYLSARESARVVGGIIKGGGHNQKMCWQWLILVWLILSFIPAFTGGKLYGHYFYQVYPQMCILAGGAAIAFLDRVRTVPVTVWKRTLIAIFAAGIVVPAIGFTIPRFFAGRIYNAIGEENPEDYRPIARYVRERTQEDDRIFVWGFATPIYFYAERKPASRFIWCDWLTGRISGTPSAKDPDFDTTEFITPGSWDMFFEDMERHRPIYFVDTSPGKYHDYGKYPVAKYPALVEFLKRNYTLEASVNKADIYRRVVP